MPTNVTAEYVFAAQEYKKSNSVEKKIAALENMLSKAPTHKGAEKLRQDINTELAKYKAKFERKAKQKSKGKSLTIKNEAATIVLVGPPNSGKSTLLNKLTGKKVDIGDYEFTTKKPEVGIMKYKGIKLRIIEVPAITEGYGSRDKGPSYFAVIRNADLVVIITDTTELDDMFKEFENAQIALNDELDESKTYLKTIIVINKADLDSFDETYLGLCKYHNFDLIPISSKTDNLNMLKERLWRQLGIIKIYEKKQDKRANKEKAICLEKYAVLEDFAQLVNKNYQKKFQYARVWGKSAKVPGMKVNLNHQIEDEDTIELVMSK